MEASLERLLLASTNNGKLREMIELLEDLPVELVTPAQIGLSLVVEENGETYAENAALKALQYARASGLLTLGDDSGLEVDALEGQPGIRSARFSPKKNAADADRRQYLLECLKEKPQPWLAHFHCTVAIATPAGELSYAEGECFGEIIPQERGSNGFGYDPIFQLRGMNRTMAELSTNEKNRLSHRACALQAAHPVLTIMITPKS
jgi:XTP/dITP diphosphohydrolase